MKKKSLQQRRRHTRRARDTARAKALQGVKRRRPSEFCGTVGDLSKPVEVSITDNILPPTRRNGFFATTLLLLVVAVALGLIFVSISYAVGP